MDRPRDWDYQLSFKVDAASLKRDHVDLVFDGLDTFAEVSLNGQRLLAADNMFRRWRVPVKEHLHAGSNTLLVHLQSPIARLLPWLLKQPYALPGEFDSAFGDEPKGKQTSNYVRKANYQYGWDWGPRYVTLGIWQPVRLESWDSLRLADFHIAQPKVDADVAQLRAELDVRADHAGAVEVQVDWIAPDGGKGQQNQRVELKAGENHLAVPLRIDHPQRWWPVGYGAPNLYHFHANVTADGAVVASGGARYWPAQRRTASRQGPLGSRLRLRRERRADLRQGREPDSVRQLSPSGPRPGGWKRSCVPRATPT